MRRLLLLPLLFSLLLIGCGGKHHYPAALLMADSLCDVNPKAAIDNLDRLAEQMTQAPEADRMYYRLLCIKAADKAYIPHTSDSLIRTVLDYYEHGGDPQLLPTAYYYGGRVSMDLGDAPQAIGYYRKALDAMPTGSCSPLRGKVLHQLGRLYWDQHVNEEALSYYQEALKNSYILNDTADVLFNLEALAGVCEDKNLTDSALFFYQSAYLLSEQFQDTILKSDICTQLARFYVSMGNNEQAKPYMQFSLKHIDEDNLTAVYSMASKYYMAIQQTDSAIYYSHLELARPNVYSKEGACRQLTDLYIQKGDLKKADEYIILYKLYHDSVRARHAAEDVARINALYNQHVNEQKILRLQLNDANKTLFFVIIVSVFLVFTYCLYRIVRNTRSHLKNAREKEEAVRRTLDKLRMESQEQKEKHLERISILSSQIKELQSENYNLTNDNSDNTRRLSEMDTELKELKSFVKVAEAAKRRQEDFSCIIHDTVIYNRLSELLHNGLHPSKEEWCQIEDTVLGFVPSFRHEIEKFVKLSEFEYHVCLLIKMTFTPSQIKDLTMKSKEAITSTRRRLYEKAFGIKGSPADWDTFIMNIV